MRFAASGADMAEADGGRSVGLSISVPSFLAWHDDNNNLYNVGTNRPYIQTTDQDGVPLSHEQSSRGGYQQYSSQDSLPDSPYSSQSLDSQSTQGTG